MKYLKRIFSAVLAFFSLGLSACGGNAEHTELVVDGEYKPFNVPRMTMEKLMELVDAEDTDYIYKVFSSAIRENVVGLYEQIQEFVRFSKENVTSWDFLSGGGTGDRRNGVATTTRVSFYTFNTNNGIYRCDIGEVLKNTVQPDLVGFSDITIYPEELSWEYASKKPSGIYIVYRVGDQPQNISIEPVSIEILMQLAGEENQNDVYKMFSMTTKRNAEGLQEKVSELMDFLRERVTSWEPYTWTQNTEALDGATVTTQEMFFYLHTDSGLYRCDIREVLVNENQETDIGFSSISIFPALYPGEEPEYEDEVYKGYCTWGRENEGISIVYQQES